VHNTSTAPATTHSDTLPLPPLVARQAHSLTHCTIARDDPTASELASDGCECTHTPCLVQHYLLPHMRISNWVLRSKSVVCVVLYFPAVLDHLALDSSHSRGPWTAVGWGTIRWGRW